MFQICPCVLSRNACETSREGCLARQALLRSQSQLCCLLLGGFGKCECELVFAVLTGAICKRRHVNLPHI
jgi:hypothetical protein